MKLPRFSLSTVICATAIVAIAIGASVAYVRAVKVRYSLYDEFGLRGMLTIYIRDSLFWFPLAFIGFAIGRKKLTLWMVVAFAIIELAALPLVLLFLFYS